MGRSKNPVHAVILATRNGTYGHIRVSVYEAMGYSRATLLISCQTGGDTPGSYAWKYGVSSSDVMSAEELRRGHLLMRKIGRGISEMEKEDGRPANFGVFVVRLLRAARVPVAYVHRLVNASLRGPVESLPAYRTVQQYDDLVAQVQNLECSLLSGGM